MRATALCLVLCVLAGCAGGNASRSSSGAAGDALTEDLLPFEASSAVFADSKDAKPRTLRLEPSPDGTTAKLLLEIGEAPARELRLTRQPGAVYFSGGVDLGTELLRIGARPGESWQSGAWRVAFDGWERLVLERTSYDAARITARRGPQSVEHVETWWFARGVGLVRLRSDHGTLVVDELVRSGP